MKKPVFVLVWNSGETKGNVFGVYTDRLEMDAALSATASEIMVTTNNLRMDLNITEIKVNELGKS